MKPINGWNVEKIIAQVKKYNNGKKALKNVEDTEPTLCAYQADDGNRCFVGCFIPDGHPGLKYGGLAKKLLDRYPDLIPLMPFEAEYMGRFQLVHDHKLTGDVYDDLERWLKLNVET